MSIALDQPNTYRTSDLGLACALATCSVELVDIDRTHGKRAYFIFKHRSDVDSIVDSFWNGSLSVDALRFWQEQKRLKARLYGD